MSAERIAQHRIGGLIVDGEAVELVWAPGTDFVSVQFMCRTPRGIANLTGLDSEHPCVVPLSHRSWLDPARTAALLEAGRACLEQARQAHGSSRSPSTATARRSAVIDDRNVVPELFNRALFTARTP